MSEFVCTREDYFDVIFWFPFGRTEEDTLPSYYDAGDIRELCDVIGAAAYTLRRPPEAVDG